MVVGVLIAVRLFAGTSGARTGSRLTRYRAVSFRGVFSLLRSVTAYFLLPVFYSPFFPRHDKFSIVQTIGVRTDTPNAY
jgi:hypothetical protein